MPNNSPYESALSELLKLEFTGMKLGLDNIKALLASLGDPHRAFRSIHVAGTNGKGSVSAMLSGALQANGYRVGLYTSPHLVDVRERIKIGSTMISEAAMKALLDTMWPTVIELKATFFEVATALAFRYFADEAVDIAVIETGLGGRLDATNILERPLATVVTSISLEHTEFLGDTTELIAAEKAGIFKTGSPAVVNVQQPQLHSVFDQRAAAVATTVLYADRYLPPLAYSSLRSPFIGAHQEQNLRTVLATLSVLSLRLDARRSCEGIANTALLTGLRARFEECDDVQFTSRGAHLILDVAHNTDAFHVLAQHCIAHSIRPIVVIGLAKDKAIFEVFAEVARFASRVITTQAHNHRAASSLSLAEIARTLGLDAEDGGGVATAVKRASRLAYPDETVLLCGSHFVVGEYLSDRE